MRQLRSAAINANTWAQWHAAGLRCAFGPRDSDLRRHYKSVPEQFTRRGVIIGIPSAAALPFGFKNFPMDSFGVMQVSQTAVRDPGAIGHSNEQETGLSSIHFNNGRLAVSHSGNYQVRIAMVNGRNRDCFYVGQTGRLFT